MKRRRTFPGIEDQADDTVNPISGEVMLGDIVISVEKTKEQAVEYGHSEKRGVCVPDRSQYAAICSDMITWKRKKQKRCRSIREGYWHN